MTRLDMSPASRVRLAAALAAGKLTANAARLLKRGGGTSLPGLIARRVDPDVLQKVVGASQARKIIVTGSNGKTTTCRMIDAIARASGERVIQNRAGSNLIQGVTSVAVNGASVLGRLDADDFVLEIDEATVRNVQAEIEPDAIVLTNIFRDQLDRYGELWAVARALEQAVLDLPAGATAVLNGDDPLVASFAPDSRARRLYFGMRTEAVGTEVPEHAADTVRCVRCQSYLQYSKVWISHLGAFHCPNCGYARPPLDVAVTSVKQKEGGAMDVELEACGSRLAFSLPLPGLHNVYNAAAAVAGARALGLDLSSVADAFAGLRPVFGRLEPIKAGDKRVVLAFVKNPTSANTTLRTIAQTQSLKHVLVAASNTDVDGEDFAWLWDVDLEELAPSVSSVVTSGTKAEELAMRFKYAGVPESRMQIVHDRAAALDAALAGVEPGGDLHILSGYTPTRELRWIMHQRGWVPPFWEE